MSSPSKGYGGSGGGLLETSRIAVSILPEKLIAKAAHEAGIRLEELRPTRQENDVVLRDVDAARVVMERAVLHWWELLPPWTRIDFTMQHQEQTQWCWAATSVSVALYYSALSGWMQCHMVNLELGQATCCEDGSTSACNQPNVLDSPLDRARVLDQMQNGSVGIDAIRDEIDGGRPLAWRIGWSGGGGHFAVIEGYQQGFGVDWVAVDDPWYGPSDVALSTLTGGTYQGTGTWTHTYFTRRTPSIFELPPLEPVFTFPPEIWEHVLAEEASLVEGGDEG